MKSVYYLFMIAFLAPTFMYAQPANDNCSGALSIEINGPAVTADNTDATAYGPQGSCLFGTQDDGDVWFTFTVTETTSLLITTEEGSSIDSQLTLFTIEDCGGPNEAYTEIACNDDVSFTSYMSEILTGPLAPGTYYLAASTYSDDQGSTNSGTYTISVTSATAPENDSCEGAITLVMDGPAEIADNSLATIVGPEGSCYAVPQAAGDTWYTFTTTMTQNVRVLTEEGTSEESQVSVYTIEDCGTGNEVYTEVGCSEDASSSNFMAIVDMYNLPAGTYYIKAGTYSNFFTGTYSISLQTLADAPVGSVCDDADAFAVDVDGIAYTISGFVSEAVDVDGFGDAHVWKSFSISECADVLIDFCAMTEEVEDAFVALFPSCPIDISTVIVSENVELQECGNIGFSFDELPAGTYYYPVFVPEDAADPYDYAFNVTATACGSVGVEELDMSSNFSVYPNPNNGSFTVVNAGVSGNYTIELIDLTGRVIHTQTSTLTANTETKISANGVASGLYILNMKNINDNTFATQTIVVE